MWRGWGRRVVIGMRARCVHPNPPLTIVAYWHYCTMSDPRRGVLAQNESLARSDGGSTHDGLDLYLELGLSTS